jgi:hypothetical protein
MTLPAGNVSAPEPYTEPWSGAIAFSFFHGNSFVHLAGGDAAPWFDLLDAAPHFFIFPPTAARRATAYSASLIADDYGEELRAALRDADVDAARHCLEVILAIAEVALSQLRGSSSEYFSVH